MKIEVYELSAACGADACGPRPDPSLPSFDEDARWLESRGVAVERHDLSRAHESSVADAAVRERIVQRGLECLPIVVADGRIVSAGAYPVRAQLAKWAGVSG